MDPVPSIYTTYPSTGTPDPYTVETPYSDSWTADQWWDAHKADVRAARSSGHDIKVPSGLRCRLARSPVDWIARLFGHARAKDRLKVVPLALLAAALLSSCTTTEQWQAALYSARFGAYAGQSSTYGSFSRVDKTIDTGAENYGVYMDIQPGKWWEMKMQAQMAACAMTEAAYERRLLEMEAEKVAKPK